MNTNGKTLNEQIEALAHPGMNFIQRTIVKMVLAFGTEEFKQSFLEGARLATAFRMERELLKMMPNAQKNDQDNKEYLN